MKLILRPGSFKFLILTFLILYASLQFLLILRHKSSYLSDSFFYKHMYYEFQGLSFEEAKRKIISQIDISKTDAVAANIFVNDDVYIEALGFFAKRPLYPYLSNLINQILNDENASLILPIFLSYIGIIFTSFVLLTKGLNYTFAALGTFLFLSFYPFLDWSTYFLTDTIGAWFWMTILFFTYKFLKTGRKKWVIYYTITFAVSVLNREQSVLFLLLLILIYILAFILKMRTLFKPTSKLFAVSLLISLVYFFVSLITNQKNIIDTLKYTINNYGFHSNSPSPTEIINFLVNQYFLFHKVIIRDLMAHHIWVVVLVFSILGVLVRISKLRLIDIMFLTSAIASYSFVFIFPEVTYKFYYPLVVTICYFAATFLEQIFTYNLKFSAFSNDYRCQK